jgi:single-strand DNA-binding protein
MKRLTVTGNIGRDPEMRLDPNGHQFATFSVGISVGNKVSPKTDWVDVTCNGKLAEIITTYGKKGRKVLVDGFPYVNAYINKDNLPVGTLRVFANSIELLCKSHDDSEDIAESLHHDVVDHIDIDAEKEETTSKKSGK